jgi:hypothetical protein
MFGLTRAKEQYPESSTPLFSAATSPDKKRAERWLKDRIDRAKREGVFVELAKLTPVLAELLVADDVNADNRTKKWGKIEQWASAITRGEWELNGETIIISRDGKLNDGQNRCLAVIKAGRPIDVLMVFGVDRETRRSVDTGTGRTLGDVFDMAAEKNAKAVAAAVRMLWLYENGRLPAVDAPTHAQGVEVLERHPGLRESVLPAQRVYYALRGSLGTWTFCHYVCSLIDRELADEIFEQLASGLGFSGKRDPVYRTREHLRDMRSVGKIVNTWQQAALTLKLWNMKRGFERAGLPSYDSSEAFPVAR